MEPMRMGPSMFLGMILLFILIYNRKNYMTTMDTTTALRCLMIATLLGIDQPGATVSAIPFMTNSSLKWKSLLLAFHTIREAIVANIINFFHMPGKENPADCLTKFVTGA